jgi:hypothetical protein
VKKITKLRYSTQKFFFFEEIHRSTKSRARVGRIMKFSDLFSFLQLPRMNILTFIRENPHSTWNN